ncbi:MAG: DUF1801 domain-containing protein [Chloroflexi bacterium]|nr:DUF1801 domain-containing protein [Chloroflexota bacterium]
MREIPGALRQLILEAGTSPAESIKWGNSVYSKKGNVYYLAAAKANVYLGFFNGGALSGPEARPGKRTRCCKAEKVSDILHEQFAS